MLINKSAVRKLALDEAARQGKSRLERVGGSVYRHLERDIAETVARLVALHPHGGPKTIEAPEKWEDFV